MAEMTTTCARCGQAFDSGENGCPACGRLQNAATCERHHHLTAEGQCVICGSPVCDACTDRTAVHYSCPEHREIPIIEGWAQVYTTSDDVEAGLIRDNLQSEGIDAAVLSQKDQSFAVDMGDLSPVRVLVPAFEYREAFAILQDRMDPSGEVAFACAFCGEPLESHESGV